MSRLQRLFSLLVMVAFQIMVPVTLTLLGARLLMTPQYLAAEYNRADFPADYYGFTTQDRLTFGPYAIDYMLYNKPGAYLGDLRFTDGSPFYNPRELQHMADVQNVAQAAFGTLAALLAIQGLLFAIATRSRLVRWSVWRGLIGGAVLTFLILIGVVLFIAVAWDQFFTQFHELFFQSGTWVFEYSDSLIRLYPVRFWQDAAINIGIFAGFGAAFILLGSWWWARRYRPAASG